MLSREPSLRILKNKTIKHGHQLYCSCQQLGKLHFGKTTHAHEERFGPLLVFGVKVKMHSNQIKDSLFSGRKKCFISFAEN